MLLSRNRVWPTTMLTTIVAVSAFGARAERKDLDDLARHISLVRELYPSLPDTATVRALVETLGDLKESPRIDLSILPAAGRRGGVEGGGAARESEQLLYTGASAFDRVGRLDAYSGRAREGHEHYVLLEARLGDASADEAQVRALLRELGAPFAVIAPTARSCRSLRVIAAALGAEEPLGAATRGPLAWAADEKHMWPFQLAWRVSASAMRGDRTVTYWVVVAPWGEVLSVSREGRPFP